MFHEYSSLHFAHMKAFQGDEMEEEGEDKREGVRPLTKTDHFLASYHLLCRAILIQ